MGFFQKPVLTKKRRKELDRFRSAAIKALSELAKRAPNDEVRQLYERMAHNVEKTPLVFYPRRNLKEKIFRLRGRIFGTVTKGEHVNRITIVQQGMHRFVIMSDYINLPAEHVFDGEKLSISGIFTLSHEYAHFPKPQIASFASAYSLGAGQAEELLADLLAAKLAVKMGYPKEHVLKHFRGRGVVYGTFPFEKFIKEAVK